MKVSARLPDIFQEIKKQTGGNVSNALWLHGENSSRSWIASDPALAKRQPIGITVAVDLAKMVFQSVFHLKKSGR